MTNNYPDEIYDCPVGAYAGKREWERYGPHTKAGVMAQRAYILGKTHGARDDLTGWANLTKAIEDRVDIDWERLEGLPAKCVHEELGSLTSYFVRDTNCADMDLPHSWYSSDMPNLWADAFVSAWTNLEGWVLYVQGEIPLKRKTADQLKPGTCFLGRTDSNDELCYCTRYNGVNGKKLAVHIAKGQVSPAKEFIVLHEYGIGTFQEQA